MTQIETWRATPTPSTPARCSACAPSTPQAGSPTPWAAARRCTRSLQAFRGRDRGWPAGGRRGSLRRGNGRRVDPPRALAGHPRDLDRAARPGRRTGSSPVSPNGGRGPRRSRARSAAGARSTACHALRVTAKADRIDRAPDGSYAIYDYKSGRAPCNSARPASFTRSLPLEAAIAGGGRFRGPAAADALHLELIGLDARKILPLDTAPRPSPRRPTASASSPTGDPDIPPTASRPPPSPAADLRKRLRPPVAPRRMGRRRRLRPRPPRPRHDGPAPPDPGRHPRRETAHDPRVPDHTGAADRQRRASDPRGRAGSPPTPVRAKPRCWSTASRACLLDGAKPAADPLPHLHQGRGRRDAAALVRSASAPGAMRPMPMQRLPEELSELGAPNATSQHAPARCSPRRSRRRAGSRSRPSTPSANALLRALPARSRRRAATSPCSTTPAPAPCCAEVARRARRRSGRARRRRAFRRRASRRRPRPAPRIEIGRRRAAFAARFDPAALAAGARRRPAADAGSAPRARREPAPTTSVLGLVSACARRASRRPRPAPPSIAALPRSRRAPAAARCSKPRS